MTERVADSLVIVMTQGASLRSWRESAMLPRAWALYRLLKPHFGRVVLVSFGQANDFENLAPLLQPGDSENLSVICNAEGVATAEYLAALPGLVRAQVEGSSTVLVRTTQMAGGEYAVTVRDALRDAGMTAGLMARGGFLWSRYVAVEAGAGTMEARRAGESEGRLCTAADLVVGSTGKMADDLAWRYCLRDERMRVVPNYVLLDRAPLFASERPPESRGKLLSVGQLTLRKRYHLLLEAISQLESEQRESISLHLIGEGPERANLEKQAAELSIPLTITPHVQHEEMLDLMQTCAVYLQSSSVEGHPKAVLEAMSLGTPVIVADAPGLSSIVEHGLTGLKVPGSAQGFAHTLGGLLEDENWRDTLGQAAAQAVRERYGLPSVLQLELEAEQSAMRLAAVAIEPQRKAG